MVATKNADHARRSTLTDLDQRTINDRDRSHQAGAGAVVIAGAGHVRNDVGVPMYLSARALAKRVVSVGFVEVDADLHAIGDYVRSPATAFPFDYVWFTTAAKRNDPCGGLVMPNRQ